MYNSARHHDGEEEDLIMATLGELFGILACFAPIVAIVLYMAWATRRPRCPSCKNALPPDLDKCPHCGEQST